MKTTSNESVVLVGYSAAGKDIKVRFDKGDWIPAVIRHQLADGIMINATLQARKPGFAK